jgi:hypothetical protein
MVTLIPTVSRPVCFDVRPPHLGPKPDFYYYQRDGGLLMWGALSDDKTGVSFTIAAGSCQRSHSRVRFLPDP